MTRPRQTICIIPVAQLSVHPGNIRDDLGDLEDMARSVREHGILQPLTVTEHPTARLDGPNGGKPIYRILDGHRRFKSALLAHETKIPVIIRHGIDDTAEQTIVMLVTGVHRRELSAIERAKGYGRLHDAGLSMSEIGRRVGLKPSSISYYLNLLRLDDDVIDKIERGEVAITEAVASVREERKAERAAEGKPARGRPALYFGPEHPLAHVVKVRCKNRAHQPTYGATGCGPCWEAAIRDHALAQGGAA